MGPGKADENLQFRDFIWQHLKTSRTENYSRKLSFSLSHVHGSVVDFFFNFFFSLGVVRETGTSVLTDPKNRRDFNLRDIILLETEEQMS